MKFVKFCEISEYSLCDSKKLRSFYALSRDIEKKRVIKMSPILTVQFFAIIASAMAATKIKAPPAPQPCGQNESLQCKASCISTCKPDICDTNQGEPGCKRDTCKCKPRFYQDQTKPFLKCVALADCP
ncbi:uncharacterized protein LOC117180397 [Belonocnema kinseyi]|uniref:uncharacterized protein LOC117180397 n=1 Tax=Belonocnema kinseyi TaxID=2817044 RepID=UPI00143D6ACB|nr:uncharacterized protein LOC117180397 [Belonocnema kinseyi]